MTWITRAVKLCRMGRRKIALPAVRGAVHIQALGIQVPSQVVIGDTLM